MKVRRELWSETAVVGASTALAGLALSSLGFRTGNVSYWFLLGAVAHLGWEASGGNRWYVENRDPRDFPKGLL